MANTNTTWNIGDILVGTYFKGKDARFNSTVTYLGEGDSPDTFKGKDKDGRIFSDWVRDGFVLKQ